MTDGDERDPVLECNGHISYRSTTVRALVCYVCQLPEDDGACAGENASDYRIRRRCVR